jgi:tetratricopeptide (TPR) repeat protein
MKSLATMLLLVAIPVIHLVSDSSLYAADKVALLVGINSYDKRGLNDLNYAERDVESLSEVLKKHGFNVKVLLGSLPKADPQRATKKNINNLIDTWLLSNRDKSDIVLVAFCGHGVQKELVEAKRDNRGEVYYDVVRGPQGNVQEDAYYIPVDGYKDDNDSLISLTGVMSRFGQKGGVNLLLVDACRDDPTRSARSISGNELNGRLPANTGVLFSCAAGQQALEAKEIGGGHGVFMYHIIEGLDGQAADPDGNLNWAYLEFYVKKQVNNKASELFPDRARKNSRVQTPHGFNNFVDVPILASINKEKYITPVEMNNNKPNNLNISSINKNDKTTPNESPAKGPYDEGIKLYDLRSYEAAIQKFDKAISLDSKYASAYIERGMAYHKLGKPDQGFADLDEAIRLNPTFYYAFFNRGLAYYNSSQMNKAIPDYDEALRLNPEYAIAYNNRGLCYYTLQNYTKAKSDFDMAIKYDPKFAMAYSNRGANYNAERKYDLAISDCTEAIHLNPALAVSYVDRGIAYSNINEHDRAILDYNEALSIEPENSTAFFNRAFSYDIKKDYKASIKDYTEAIRLNPKSQLAYYNRGTAYYNIADDDKAIEDLNESIRMNPEHDRSYYNRSLALRAKGKIELADADLQKAKDLGYEVPPQTAPVPPTDTPDMPPPPPKTKTKTSGSKMPKSGIGGIGGMAK